MPAATWIVVGTRSCDCTWIIAPAPGSRLFRDMTSRRRPERPLPRAVLAGEVAGRAAAAQSPLLALDAGELDRRREQHGLQRLEAGRRARR